MWYRSITEIQEVDPTSTKIALDSLRFHSTANRKGETDEIGALISRFKRVRVITKHTKVRRVPFQASEWPLSCATQAWAVSLNPAGCSKPASQHQLNRRPRKFPSASVFRQGPPPPQDRKIYPMPLVRTALASTGGAATARIGGQPQPSKDTSAHVGWLQGTFSVASCKIPDRLMWQS
jgi:hypothetical protein